MASEVRLDLFPGPECRYRFGTYERNRRRTEDPTKTDPPTGPSSHDHVPTSVVPFSPGFRDGGRGPWDSGIDSDKTRERRSLTGPGPNPYGRENRQLTRRKPNRVRLTLPVVVVASLNH